MAKVNQNHQNRNSRQIPNRVKESLFVRILKFFKLHDWFKMVGGICLFLAWFADKTQADWVVEKENLKRSQMVIDLLEIERANYEHPLELAIRQEKKDSTDMAFLKQRLSRIYLDLLTQGIGRVAEKNGKDTNYNELYEQERARKICMDSVNRVNFLLHNYKKIDDSFDVAFLRYAQNFFYFEDIHGDKWWYVRNKAENWDKIFRWSYWIGSILIAISFVLEKKTKTLTN